MCGIYGFSLKNSNGSSLTSQQRIILHAVMGAAMEERGNQAYGYVARYAAADRSNGGNGSSNSSGIAVRKRVGPLSGGARKIMAATAAAYQCFVHTRYATHGQVSKRNSHPFRQGAIIGVHNGIISNHEVLNVTHGRDFDVDSQHIFQHLADGLPLNELTGYGAIVYTYDSAPESGHSDTLYLGKFNGGQLSMARMYVPGSASDSKAGAESFGVVFASTRSAVEAACAMAGIEAESLRVDDGTLYSISEGKAYTVTAGALNVGKSGGKQDSRTSGFASWDGFNFEPKTGKGKGSSYSHSRNYGNRYGITDDDDVTAFDSADDSADDPGGELDDNGNTVAMFGRVLSDCMLCGCYADRHLEDFCTECGYQCSDLWDGGNSDMPDEQQGNGDGGIQHDDAFDEAAQDAVLAELVNRMATAETGNVV